MSTLFMIGNGFDLNCGLNTRFSDVYPGYIQSKSNSQNVELFKKMIDDQIKWWGDFEVSMAEKVNEFKTEREFIECVDDFSVYLKGYLKREELEFEKVIEKYNVESKIDIEMSRSISNFYSGITNNINDIMNNRSATRYDNISYVSFNYTNCFDMLIKEAYNYNGVSRPKVCHIHGTINDLVLGMDNEQQFDADFSISNKFKRRFIKPFFNDQYDKTRVEETRRYIRYADTICVYGMSLGESDLTWRNMLLDWVRADNQHYLIMYDYDLSTVQYSSISDRMNIEEDAEIKKLEEWGVLDYGDIIDRFKIVCGKNIFNIQKCIEAEKEKSEEINNSIKS